MRFNTKEIKLLSLLPHLHANDYGIYKDLISLLLKTFPKGYSDKITIENLIACGWVLNEGIMSHKDKPLYLYDTKVQQWTYKTCVLPNDIAPCVIGEVWEMLKA